MVGGQKMSRQAKDAIVTGTTVGGAIIGANAGVAAGTAAGGPLGGAAGGVAGGTVGGVGGYVVGKAVVETIEIIEDPAGYTQNMAIKLSKNGGLF